MKIASQTAPCPKRHEWSSEHTLGAVASVGAAPFRNTLGLLSMWLLPFLSSESYQTWICNENKNQIMEKQNYLNLNCSLGLASVLIPSIGRVLACSCQMTVISFCEVRVFHLYFLVWMTSLVALLSPLLWQSMQVGICSASFGGNKTPSVFRVSLLLGVCLSLRAAPCVRSQVAEETWIPKYCSHL